eukprot:TRINITY_DN2034_c7_g1_i1.p1 TRINITY_DN2034_c7_g1~~TRINITY_DN2034_c7_g1_i1.p1  ORF type:complete len:347 (+),score=69.00 TRINITY_DN2034_c7_g1_i1:41-1042(+)
MERTKRPFRGGWNKLIDPSTKCYKATRNREPYGPCLEEKHKRMRTAVGEITFNVNNEILQKTDFEFAYPPVEAYPKGWFKISDVDEKANPAAESSNTKPTPEQIPPHINSPCVPTPVRRLTFSGPSSSERAPPLCKPGLPPLPVPLKSTKPPAKAAPVPITPFTFKNPLATSALTTGAINHKTDSGSNVVKKPPLTVRSTAASRVRSLSTKNSIKAANKPIHTKIANYNYVPSKVKAAFASSSHVEQKRDRKAMSPIDASQINSQPASVAGEKKTNLQTGAIFTFAKSTSDSCRARAVEKARRQAVLRSRAYCEKRAEKHHTKQTIANPRWHW